jgi:hypothetical protein
MWSAAPSPGRRRGAARGTAPRARRRWCARPAERRVALRGARQDLMGSVHRSLQMRYTQQLSSSSCAWPRSASSRASCFTASCNRLKISGYRTLSSSVEDAMRMHGIVVERGEKCAMPAERDDRDIQCTSTQATVRSRSITVLRRNLVSLGTPAAVRSAPRCRRRDRLQAWSRTGNLADLAARQPARTSAVPTLSESAPPHGP